MMCRAMVIVVIVARSEKTSKAAADDDAEEKVQVGGEDGPAAESEPAKENDAEEAEAGDGPPPLGKACLIIISGHDHNHCKDSGY